MDILFNCTALGIHLCKTSQLYILKTRLGGEIYSSDVNMHKGYSGVRSIGKSGIRFENSDFGFAIERKIRKRISSLTCMRLDFLLTVRLGNPKKDLENCPKE